jgi:vacuolar iron transporter family protein
VTRVRSHDEEHLSFRANWLRAAVLGANDGILSTSSLVLGLEERELAGDPEGELAELAGIYERRGLSLTLAAEVAEALSAHGALEAHVRDELGLPEDRRARPLQAAGASALSFATGAILPLLAIGIFGSSVQVVACIVTSAIGALVGSVV